jgi:aquaporin Z
MAETPLSVKLVAEFVGTFLLIFTIGCNVMSQVQVWAPVSIACVLMVSIYTFGGVSGANFNPAVSFALMLTKAMGGNNIGMDVSEVGMYSVVQLIAGGVAGLCYHVMFGDAFHLGPAKDFGLRSAGPCELFYTFMLCFVVLNVAVATKASRTPTPEPNHFYGLAIGFVIVAGAYGAGAISGGCFNPAVAFGIAVGSFEPTSFQWFLAYTVFQLLGSALAVVMFKLVRPDEFDANVQLPFTPSLFSKLLSEFLGTYMLVLTVGLNVLGKSPAGAFSIAASLMCMIYALGDVSGANFNPAVTLAIYLSKWNTFSGKEVALYMLVQIAGGITAAFTYASIYYYDTFPLGPGKGHTWTQVSMAETIFTAVLCMVVLCCAVSPKTKTDNLFGLAIGSCVTVGGFAIGSISGGSLNPAVSCGIAMSQLINGGFFFKAVFYSVCEFLGAAVAAGIVSATHASDEK